MGCIFHFGVTNTRIQTHTHTKKKIQNVKCNLHIFLLHKKIFISLNIDLKKVTFKKKKRIHTSFPSMPPEMDVFIWISRVPLSNWKLSENKACHKANTWKVVGPELGPSVFWYSTGFKEVPWFRQGTPERPEKAVWKGSQSEQDILSGGTGALGGGPGVLRPGQDSLRSWD